MQPSGALQYEGNNFDGAVLPGRPQLPADLPNPADMMRLAVSQPAEPHPGRESCELVILISSAAGYERRRQAIRTTYLTLLHPENTSSPLSQDQQRSIRYRFLLGAPRPEQAAALAAEQEEHGDLLQVAVPESYESLWPKVVACWRWAHATYDFGFWMHVDDDSFIRLELLLNYLSAPDTPKRGLYAGYIWDGSEGRRTAPLRDPSAKSGQRVESAVLAAPRVPPLPPPRSRADASGAELGRVLVAPQLAAQASWDGHALGSWLRGARGRGLSRPEPGGRLRRDRRPAPMSQCRFQRGRPHMPPEQQPRTQPPL